MNAGMGHNRPPLDEQLVADLREVTAPLEQRRQEILDRIPKIVIRNENDIGQTGDMAKLIRALTDEVENKKSEILGPIYQARDRVTSAVEQFNGPLDDARKNLSQLVDDFREDQRLKVEEKKRKQREVVQARARAQNIAVEPEPEVVPAPVKRAAPSRGDYGGRVGQRENTQVEIEDFSKLPEYILHSKQVKEAVLKVARSFASNLEEIPGIKITRALKTNFT